MHPFMPNVKHLTDAELEERIQELTVKYFQSQNQGLRDQVKLFLDDYRGELDYRRRKTWEDQYARRDKDLDKLINVN